MLTDKQRQQCTQWASDWWLSLPTGHEIKAAGETTAPGPWRGCVSYKDNSLTVTLEHPISQEEFNGIHNTMVHTLMYGAGDISREEYRRRLVVESEGGTNG